MKKILALLILTSLFACTENGNKNQNTENENIVNVNEKIFVKLGDEEQYVEMTGTSDQLPVLLFLHGGPGWPQTPHLRYFNDDLTKEMIVVSWDQAGCGLSYMRNPNPKNLSKESLVNDAHELTQYLKKKFNKEKIVLLGFSYGSVIGLKLAEKYPEDYYAYIGVSQLIDSDENWEISMQWLHEQAEKSRDTADLNQLIVIEQNRKAAGQIEVDEFMDKYKLLVKYNGTIYNPEIAKEIEKAEQHTYEDYEGYDWYEAFYYTSSKVKTDGFKIDLTHIKSIDIPVIFMAGRHDWNLPGEVAERYLESLKAPQKEYIWFDQSGHEPPEEEPEEFNKAVIEIVKEKSR